MGPTAAFGQASGPVIRYDVLMEACDKVLKSAATDDTTKKVMAFCALPINPLISAPEWRAWDTTAVPSTLEIAAAVRKSEALRRLDQIRMFGPTESDLRIKEEIEELEVAWRSARDLTSGRALLNQSAILYGVADFVVGRVRENIHAYGLAVFIDAVCNKAPRPFLPTTCTLLERARDSGALPALAPLRDAVRSDLLGAPRVIADSLLARTQDTSKIRNALAVTLLASHIGYGAYSRRDFLGAIGEAFKSVPAVRLSCQYTPAAALLFELSAVASALADGPELLKEDDGRIRQYEYGLKTLIVNLRADPGIRRKWFGKDQHCPDIEHATGTGLFEVPKVYATILVLDRGVQAVRAAQEYLESTKTTPGGALADAHSRLAITLANAFFDLADATLRLSGKEFDVAAAVIGGFRGISVSLLEGSFGSALAGTIRIVVDVDALTNKTDSPLSKAMPYLGFAADVAEAQDAGSVTQALNRVAAPRTSFLRKRLQTQGLYFSVNAYGGAIAGLKERAEATNTTSQYIGPYLPLGVEMGRAVTPWLSAGVFAQVLDLGALGAYRANGDDEVSSAPEVGFAQVFSPGVGVVFGVARLPLTVGWLAWSVTPRLRTVTTGGIETETAVTRRWLNGFVAVDVPLF